MASALKGEPTADGTTEKKFFERGKVIKASDESIIFEVERHRSVGGCYRKGLPMPAYTTYMARYILDRKTGDVSKESDTPVSTHYDLDAIAEDQMGGEYFGLSIEKAGEDGYLIMDMVNNDSATIKTCEEAKEFAANIVSDYCMEPLFPEIEEALGAEKYPGFITDLRTKMAGIARSRAEECWQSRDTDSD